jgi:hypothetical protein
MDPTSAVVVLCLFLFLGLGAYLLPKEKPPRKPDHIHHTWDNN